MVQRGHAFAIVDEVDSILIDEARTPLIISGQGDEMHRPLPPGGGLCRPPEVQVLRLHRRQGRGGRGPRRRLRCRRKGPHRDAHRPRHRTRPRRPSAWKISRTPKTPRSCTTSTRPSRAHGIMKRDVDYVVKDGEVIIVDEFTGRLMLGRRYSDGLHQAIEAKEHVQRRRARTRRWRPSRSRTTSVSTASSPA